MGDEWNKIEDAYFIGDRYLLADKPDKNGACKKGYRRPVLAKVFSPSTTPAEMTDWQTHSALVSSVCLPEPGTEDPNMDWFEREEKRNLEFKSAHDDKNGNFIRYDENEWYTPDRCKGGWCPMDFLPNARQVNQVYAESYLETPLDCKHQGGRWVTNHDGLSYKVGGICLFKKGVKPKFVQAAAYENKPACIAAGFKWDEKWLNNFSKWSSPCYYLPSKEDYDSYIGDLDYWRKAGLAGSLTKGLNEAPTAAESLLEWLTWAADWVNMHKTAVIILLGLYFGLPILANILEIL